MLVAQREFIAWIPLGEWEGGVVLAEFKLSRNCRMGHGVGESNEFWVVGHVALASSSGDSLELLEAVDTFYKRECVCKYDDHFEKTRIQQIMDSAYILAVDQATALKGFTPLISRSIIFNDTANLHYRETINDSTFEIYAQYENRVLVLSDLEIISCYPKNLSEVRTYRTANFQIEILRMRCHLHDSEYVERQKSRFDEGCPAIWKEKAQWHGIARDYLEIVPAP